MSLKLGKQLQKFLKNLPATQRNLVLNRLNTLGDSDRNLDIKPLKGNKRIYFRLRVGQIRVIFTRLDKNIFVLKIGFRGDVY
ncbi:plasmid stabilization protein [candidate division WWE3 bacterium CG_4_9_14_0_2_um_filter_35_11]|uniref:Plasmid stabilization protein n=1 Tax=candidate division WWE3 bacterium CG_4_9_14_0_2_um_filter_35_11 TaxID=1975077 RepID=A0A2M8ELY4_UNCKA|nr:MAG: plasmid stabilization protein [candidate division WWE3 bacterium CG10_big_fil_rev_8_21_14_0_10_35_32]PJC23754.1 MAG: plasmid stabilization protein [candidate division WWE3 bacterium CG_4_9_14_0_2_um_filter_35_11]